MKQKTKKIILFGMGDFAQIANLYFMRDTEYEVVAFTVDRAYMKGKEFCGLPVVPFDELNEKYPPDSHDIHVAIVYDNLNRTRAAKCEHAKAKGYSLASYISPHAFVAPTAKLGAHHFIFESNVIQDFVEIGDRVVFWSGDHCGHHSVIGDNVFVSSHVVISGHCSIGDNCFLGVNSTLANNTVLGAESWVMPCAYLSGTIPPNSFVKTEKGAITPLNEKALEWALKRASEKARE